MHIFRDRPLALGACVMALTAVLAQAAPGRLRLVLSAFCLLSSMICVTVGLLKKRLGRIASVCTLCLISAAVAWLGSWFFFSCRTGIFSERVGEELTVEGYVAERLNAAPHQSRFRVELSEIDGERSSGRVLLECDYLSSLQPGEVFRLTGRVRAPENTAAYPEETVLYADGYIGILCCEDSRSCTVYPEPVQTVELLLKKWNLRLCDRLQAVIGGEAGALAGALLLGNRSMLSDDTVLSFRRAGISHILALSGLHVSVLIGVLELLLRLLGLPRRLRAFLIPPAALFYFGLTGCAPSTFRAVVMTCVLYLGLLFLEQYDSFTALCAALMLLLTVTPYAVLDVSLWLSFTAASAIVLFMPAATGLFSGQRWKYRPRWISRLLRTLVTALAVGLFSNAAILPLLALFFGSSSVFSVPATLLLSPLLTLTLVLPALVLLFPAFPPAVFLAENSLRLMLAVAGWFSGIPNGTVLLDGWLQTVLLLLLALSLILCAVLRLRRRGWLMLPLALSVAVLAAGSADVLPRGKGICVTYLREEENEALLLSYGKDAVAVDFSDGSVSIGQSLREALTSARCTELRELVFTHYHSKMSYLIASLSADAQIFALRLPAPINEKEQAIAARLEQEAGLHGISVIYGGGVLALPGAELLACRRTDTEAIEVPVLLMLRINRQIVTYLGAGAAQSDWADIAQNAVLSSDVLIFGRHGTQPGTQQLSLRLPEHAELLLFGSRELMNALPAVPESAQILQEVEYHRFFLK